MSQNVIRRLVFEWGEGEIDENTNRLFQSLFTCQLAVISQNKYNLNVSRNCFMLGLANLVEVVPKITENNVLPPCGAKIMHLQGSYINQYIVITL